MMFTDTNCFYLTFIVKGGRYNPVNKKLSKHEMAPVFSNEKVCIRSCGAGMNFLNIFCLYLSNLNIY